MILIDDSSFDTKASPMKPISSESLSKKVVRGGIWVFSLRIINRGLGFVRTIILARLLAPEDFGLLGIAMLAKSTILCQNNIDIVPILNVHGFQR